MNEVIYVVDPDDRVGIRCFDQSGDGITSCKRRKGHPFESVVEVKTDTPGESYIVKFGHRGVKNGVWYSW